MVIREGLFVAIAALDPHADLQLVGGSPRREVGSCLANVVPGCLPLEQSSLDSIEAEETPKPAARSALFTSIRPSISLTKNIPDTAEFLVAEELFKGVSSNHSGIGTTIALFVIDEDELPFRELGDPRVTRVWVTQGQGRYQLGCGNMKPNAVRLRSI